MTSHPSDRPVSALRARMIEIWVYGVISVLYVGMAVALYLGS